MLKPIALSQAHAETNSLKDSLAVLTDLLRFEKVAEGPGSITLRHPSSSWELILNDGGADAPRKARHHHYGVRVIKNDEIRAADHYLQAHAAE